jgi:hypothetical protein
MPTRIAGNDPQMRRKVDAVVLRVRREIADACIEIVNEYNEPALEQQG